MQAFKIMGPKKVRIGFYQNNLKLRGVGRYMLTLIEGLDRGLYEPVFYLKPLLQDPETVHYRRILEEMNVSVRWLELFGLPAGDRLPLPPEKDFNVLDFCTDNPRVQKWLKQIFPRRTLHALAGYFFYLKLSLRARKAFAAEKLDVIHFNYGTFHLHPYLAIGARLARIKAVIATLHGVEKNYTGRTAAEKMAQKIFARSHHQIICVEENLRDAARTSHGIDPARIAVIHNGIELGPAGNGEKRARTDARTRTVLVPASLTEDKGHAVLLHAVALLKGEFPGARFIFAGEGESRESLELIAGLLNVSDQIEMPGYVSGMEALYEQADFIALPSISEECPFAVLEAARASKPVLASDLGAVRLLMGGEKSGRLVPPDDPRALASALRELLSAPEKTLREMGENLRAHAAANFTRSEMLQKTLAAYGLPR